MNPFDKYIKGEDAILQHVGNYVKLQYPNAVWFHPVNEGRRTKFEQFKAKATHITSGVPDLLFLNPLGVYTGLAIELKFGKNKATPNQKEWLDKLTSCGWLCRICYSFDESKLIIDEYYNQKIK